MTLPAPYYQSDDATLHQGDCLAVMALMEPESVDAIVCDPPYGLSFMGKEWDHGVPGEAFWREALRIAKPGAHLLAFGGTRTFHRLMVAIEDAGWEIRDTLMWVYGSGFPKSRDVSKAIDSEAGAERASVMVTKPEDLFESEREVVGRYNGATNIGRKSDGKMGYSPGTDYPDVDRAVTITAPATDAAKQWAGWGTALKPAWEPIILARKPLEGTVAANVLRHGTGALNIDGCRIEGVKPVMAAIDSDNRNNPILHTRSATGNGEMTTEGRWPANLIHDGSDEVVAGFPEAKSPSGVVVRAYGAYKTVGGASNHRPCHDSEQVRETVSGFGDSGSAARFFYCAKASKADRDEGLEGFDERVAAAMDGNLVDGQRLAGNGTPIATPIRRNHHPTVKPTDLMRYLCRLITPPGGIVLDPFMGSGSTGKAAILEGFRFVGIELTDEYLPIAAARCRWAQRQAFDSQALFRQEQP